MLNNIAEKHPSFLLYFNRNVSRISPLKRVLTSLLLYILPLIVFKEPVCLLLRNHVFFCFTLLDLTNLCLKSLLFLMDFWNFIHLQYFKGFPGSSFFCVKSLEIIFNMDNFMFFWKLSQPVNTVVRVKGLKVYCPQLKSYSRGLQSPSPFADTALWVVTVISLLHSPSCYQV